MGARANGKWGGMNWIIEEKRNLSLDSFKVQAKGIIASRKKN